MCTLNPLPKRLFFVFPLNTWFLYHKNGKQVSFSKYGRKKLTTLLHFTNISYLGNNKYFLWLKKNTLLDSSFLAERWTKRTKVDQSKRILFFNASSIPFSKMIVILVASSMVIFSSVAAINRTKLCLFMSNHLFFYDFLSCRLKGRISLYC